MANVTLKSVVKRYGHVEVVHGVDLEIKDNEFIVLVGPSGCGKSTVLRMVAGLEEISGGEILIDGEVVNNVSPKDRNVAMVFQNYALYPHMTVRENMGFALKMRGESRDEIAAKVNETAGILELTPYLDRKPSELSGGQRQRVAMGRAMVRSPHVFLFDEPLSNLDAQLRTQMRLELRKMHMNLKTTTMYVTHDQIEAMTLADRIVILKDGLIQQVGTPIEVFEKPENVFVAQFIGNPPMNIFEAEYVTKDKRPFIRSKGLDLPLPGIVPGLAENEKVLAGIRPDAIKVGGAVNRVPEEMRTTAGVDIAEILGGQTHLILDVGGNAMVAEVEGRVMAAAGETLDIGFEPGRLVLFDPKTTNALR